MAMAIEICPSCGYRWLKKSVDDKQSPLKSLSKVQRDRLVNYYSGMRLKEIAKLDGVSIAAVSKCISRAKIRIIKINRLNIG